MLFTSLPALHRVAFNDLIFEGRNKAYGAYELRLLYPRHLRRAAAAMLLLCAVLAAGPRVWAYLHPAAAVVVAPKPPSDVVYDTQPVPTFEAPKPPVRPATPRPQVVATTPFVPPVVVPDRAPTPETPPTTMAQANAAVNLGARPQEGADAPALPTEPPAPASAPPDAPDGVFVNVELMPQYPGGNAELLRYVAHHIRYPALALRNGIEGRVYVKFVVDETGRVTDLNVVKGIGGGCDEEAVRVLRTLSRFEPGRQNGRAVKVYFNVPIAFMIK